MLIHELTLRGILSFGPDTPPLAMQPLNVLIGPNGSGKSNLMEAIGLLRSAPTKLTAPMRGKGGSGVKEWIWKGMNDDDAYALVEAVVEFPRGMKPLRHRIEFTEMASRFKLVSEAIQDFDLDEGKAGDFYYYFHWGFGPAVLAGTEGKRQLQSEEVASDESILSQIRDPSQYPELTWLSFAYDRQVLSYREWSFGRSSVLRGPQPTDVAGDRLEEDFSNLGMFLNRLRGKPKTKKAIIEHLRDLYEGLDDFDARITSGTVEVELTEGDHTFPASRLSDGTLRYLCLLAILCDPEPPALIGIEEPELGLHPDLLPKIADLLVAASERTQVVVTTHSDILVDAMTERPECVVVMEKHDGKTQATRLEKTKELQQFLKKYRLGQLWLRGGIGGTRW